ncbi:hypothetical protein ACLX1H_003527 [Fusarium chlamydosporum]
MARLRSKGKAFGTTVEPEVTARSRRNERIRHSPRSSVPVQTIEQDNNASVRNTRQRSTAQTRSQNQTSSDQGRVTRSTRGTGPHTMLPPTASRKRRSSIAATQKKPLKRQHSTGHKSAEAENSSQSAQEDEEEDEDEVSIPPDAFFDDINENIGVNKVPNKLPHLRPSVGATNPAENDRRAIAHADPSDEADVGEVIVAATEEQNESQGSVGDAAEPETAPVQSEAPQSAQPLSQPDTTRKEPLRPGRRKRGRPSKKAVYSESGYGVRDPSPDLGSEPSRIQATQPTASDNKQVEKSVYDFPESDREHHDEIAVDKGSHKVPVSSSEPGRKMKQGKQRDSQSDRQRSHIAAQQQEERDGEEEEEGEDDFDISRDEPEIGSDIDTSNLGEDSLMLDAPPDDSQTGVLMSTTRINRSCVQTLVHKMTLPGWTGKRRWKDALLEEAADKSEELASQPDCRVLSTRIMVHLFKLYELCKKVPQSPKLDQLAYLREHTTQFSNLVSNLRWSIDLFISNINAIMRGANTDEVGVGFIYVEKMLRKIIPMLVLVLDTTFEAGCRVPLQSGERLAQQTGEFTIYLLELLERAAGWAHRLSQTVNGWYELHPPIEERDKGEQAQQNRVAFHSATATLKRELEKARRDLDKPKVDPEILRRKDEAIRQEREAEVQQRKESQELQMQRFRHSIQRIRSSVPLLGARPVRQEVPISHQASQPGSAPSQRSPKRSYYEQHGWHYWEDDRLLTLIRTTSHPNYENFQQMLPGRDPSELRERARYLKLVMRNKYERRGTVPPGC